LKHQDFGTASDVIVLLFVTTARSFVVRATKQEHPCFWSIFYEKIPRWARSGVGPQKKGEKRKGVENSKRMVDRGMK
jgi:hypothetical protein